MLGPEGISILGKALLIGREAVGQVADIGRLGEKSDALIALLLQKSNRFEQNLMVVIGNIRCARNGAAAVGKNNMNAACDQLADAVLIVLAVDNDDGFRIILHHIDQSALFLFTGIFITQHQDGIVLLICVLHQNAGNTGVEIIVKLGDQQADLPLFLPAHVARSQIRYIVEFADRLTHTGGRFLRDGCSAVDDMRDCPDRDTCAARDVLHGGTSILLFCVRNGHDCSYFNENVLIDSHIIRRSFPSVKRFLHFRE